MNNVALRRGVALLALLAGCASAPFIGHPTFTGQTATEGALKEDVLRMAVPYAKMGTGCQGPVQSVHTEFLSYSPDVRFDEEHRMVAGELVERWTLAFCALQKAVYVKVRGLPDGRTSFSVSSKPGEPGR